MLVISRLVETGEWILGTHKPFSLTNLQVPSQRKTLSQKIKWISGLHTHVHMQSHTRVYSNTCTHTNKWIASVLNIFFLSLAQRQIIVKKKTIHTAFILLYINNLRIESIWEEVTIDQMLQILCHFIERTRASQEFGILGPPCCPLPGAE